MWRILHNGKVVAREPGYRFAKQKMRRMRKADPTGTWTVVDPSGRKAIESVREA